MARGELQFNFNATDSAECLLFLKEHGGILKWKFCLFVCLFVCGGGCVGFFLSLFILRKRERAQAGGGQRERETEHPKQALY